MCIRFQLVHLGIQEKDSTLSDDYGKDLASVQALQRKHEGYEVRVHSLWYPNLSI